MSQQVSKKHYRFEKYCDLARWSSYYYQLKEVLAKGPESVMEVGGGDGVFGAYIKGRGIAYTSVDVAGDLKPDVIASVTDLPFEAGSFDVAVAFEVLEHIPFDQFEGALRELSRVSKQYVIISIPHFGPSVELWFKMPFLKRIKWAFKFWLPLEHTFNGEHYWEVGKKGYSAKKILSIFKKYFEVIDEYVPYENQYHHFYILRKK